MSLGPKGKKDAHYNYEVGSDVIKPRDKFDDLMQYEFKFYAPTRGKMGYLGMQYVYKVFLFGNGDYGMSVALTGTHINLYPPLWAQISDPTQLSDPELPEQIGLSLETKDMAEASPVSGSSQYYYQWGRTRCRWMAHKLIEVARADWFFRGGQGCPTKGW